jgi:hypothetical protein
VVKLSNGFLLDEGQCSLPKFQVRFLSGMARLGGFHAPDGCVDLVAMDPPFNSNRNYEVFWGEWKEGAP